MAIHHNTQTPVQDQTTDAVDTAFGQALRNALDAAPTSSDMNEEEVLNDRDGHRRDDLNYGNIYDSVGSLTSFLSGPLHVSQADQKLESVVREMRDIIIKSTDTNLGMFDIQSFDGSMIRTPWNSLVITHKDIYGGQLKAISFVVLMIESDQELQPRTVNLGKEVLEMPLTAFDLYDSNYHEAVKNQIYRTVANGDMSIPLRYSGVSMLPREYTSEGEVDTRKLLSALSHQVVSASLDETLIVEDPQANIGDLIRDKGYELVSGLMYPTTNIIGTDKLPVHADLIISTSAQLSRERERERGGYGYNTAETVVDVGLMVDLLQIENQERRGGRRGRRDDRRNEERYPYMGNVVITAVNNPRGMVTLATSLLAISTAMAATTTEVFPEMLKPKRNNAGSLGDIGAIGYQIPDADGEYGYIDVRSAEYTENGGELFYDLVFDSISPDVAVSIDIPETILGSRAVRAFTRAADNENDRRSEIHRIGSTLDNLTDGYFSDISPELGGFIETNPMLVPMGYFIDPNGQMRDLRELNFLAALTYAGNKGLSSFMDDWNESCVMADRQRGAALRIRLMKEIVGYDNVHVKGFARRHMFQGQFIADMAAATQDSGIAPVITNLQGGERRRFQVSFEQYRDYAVNHNDADRYGSRARYQRRDTSRGFERRSNRFGGW